MPETLIDVLLHASQTNDRGYTFLDDRLNPREWSFEDIHREAERRGRYFRQLGLQKGDRLAMIIPDGQDFILSFLGAVRAGIVPVPMYPPLALGKLDSYMDTAVRIMKTAKAKMLLTSTGMSSILWSLVSRVPSLEGGIHTTEKVENHDDGQVKASLEDLIIEANDTCFLQFTSGSTSDPKGVVVTHANLVANSKAIMVDGLNSDPSQDRGVSWLPLFHDMGLIGFVIAPLLTTVAVVFIPTLSFVKRPNVWMDTISKYRGTITFAPNFALGLAAKRATAKRVAELDLTSLRVLGCGAEPINGRTMRNFIQTFEPAGLSSSAIMPAYGMAEATLAIAFDDTQRPFSSVVIDRELYEAQHRVEDLKEDAESQRGLELVACGRTFPEHTMAIVNPEGEHLPEDHVGEIVFNGPSVASTYFENPEATQRSFVKGWLHTGDLGFIRDGIIYVSGRMKDIIILNGRNYYPQSIEWEVEQIEGIRRGNVVAFSTRGDDSEQLVVVAESKARPTQHQALCEAVEKRVYEQLGIRPNQVKLLPASTLPKTSSGKVQRARTKQLFENGKLEQTGSRSFGSAARLAVAKHMVASTVARWSFELGRPTRAARRWLASRRNTQQPKG